ncbi:MAG: 50S ribosomal protein L10 [Candidatus Pacebacteria bacterium]|nr:50S ribosomal protein L10 [Candidatus Paceibacterota bacterium]
MAKTKQQKTETLEQLTDAAKNAGSVVFVNFHGLGVSETNEMRSALKDEGVTYLVAKKTLTKRAIADAGVEGEVPELEGELALAWGDDQIAPARGVQEFAKKHKDSLSILGGIFEHRLVGKEEMITIASIPSLQTLYGQFANVINSPIQGFVFALNAIAEKKEA